MKQRVLFIDDDKNILASFRSLLRKEFLIDTASHPEEGLAMFKEKGPYPVVISDLKMPDMDGLTLLSKINKLNEDTIGIILTGHADLETAVTALNQGHVFRFLTKPSDKETIVNVVRAGQDQYNLITGNKLKERIIKQDLKAAAFIQESFLPHERADIGKLSLNWLFKPSDYVGGDMFDIIPLDHENTGFYLMDISGHGVSAALAAVSVSLLLARSGHLTNSKTAEIISPSELLLQLDNDFPIERLNKHFTMFYGIINSARKTLRYSSAGHLPPILLRSNGALEYLEKGGSVIGMNSGIPFEEDEVPFNPGDKLISFTDGVSEYQSQSDEMFEMERFISLVQEYREMSSREMLDHIYEKMMQFGENRPPLDDVTICCLDFEKEDENQ
ncbi:Serine phosphatase RsbU, regulator of sigma subunit [Maridesulfovibrio ferrireducens]|uniref:Serine phosphatase RsbU, regulator of sigma subunit n=1 Tax=Maridesulfovibrio ferrireducens TaxID=246191 RepID=A0A1G9EVW9_9BACT|nr:SpoIIE family protein phosphatase [Maridesulfovibrio ferrireducens]SDK80125.1 Serine phosphatase RsbU, regulator of sigma subunit [Maridesulfovibrio ferrireducens]